MANIRLPLGRSNKILADLVNFIKSSPSLINENIDTTTGASATTANLTAYKTTITTGGNAGNNPYNLGTTAIPGQRKLVTLGTRTNASDVVVLDAANILLANGSQAASVSMNAAAAFILFEFTGVKWKILYTSAAGVTAS